MAAAGLTAWRGPAPLRACPRLPAGWRALLLILPLMISPPAQAMDHDGRVRIKAAYLLNFARLVRWPEPSADQALLVCISASVESADILRTQLQGKKSRNRVLRVESVAADTVILDRRCDVHYSERAKTVPAGPLLTVGEGRDHLVSGGGIAFIDVEDRVLFAVSRANLAKRGVEVDARLFQAATEVLP